MNLSGILVLIMKDMKAWFRNPFMMLISIIPLFFMGFIMGSLVTQAESLPTGVILEDNDPIAIEIKNYIQNMTSGTGLRWFTIMEGSNELIEQKFYNGEILCLIRIPINISGIIEAGEVVYIEVLINNINDDVTKNILQRVQDVCNKFNNNLEQGTFIFYSPRLIFEGLVEPDVKFTDYIFGGVLAFTIVFSSGINSATITAHEFEKGTMKELIMSASPREVITSKLLTSGIQTVFCYIIVNIGYYLLFGFLPIGNLIYLWFWIIIGIISFSSLGIIVAVKVKQVIPAALATMIINMIGWWIGGGLVPAEVWVGLIHLLSSLLPSTYYFRSFTNIVFMNTIATLSFDFIIVISFGVISFLIAQWLYVKEAKMR
ncbi:MAG: ABC transporter permease [Candidatus Heimdallarchaeota archaeon]|nr:ABC transporter permease [Candidatus Heimdallarchaeota archaeon]